MQGIRSVIILISQVIHMKTLLQGLRYTLASCLIITCSASHALMLTPDDKDWHVYQTSALQSSDVASIVGSSSNLELFYKADYKKYSAPEEHGSFSDSYGTWFWGEPNHAKIVFTGGASIVCPECYLIVKNGKKSPQYLFDIGSWNGTDKITLKDFYKDRKGDISHIAIFGKSMVNVPEPSALILIGLGMIGLGLARRRVAR